MTSSGLRQKALRGRLIVERIAGKDFTTLAHIERMRELCRVSAKARDSSSERPRERTDASSQTPSGPSAMESAKLPQESLRARLSEIGRRRLVKYITSKYQPPRRIRDIEDIDVADVLAIYHAHRETAYSERGTSQTDITEFAGRIGRLNDFFGGRMLAEVNAQTCGQYVKARGRPGGAGRRSGRPARGDQSPRTGGPSPWLGPRGTSSERTRPRSMADAKRSGGTFVGLLAISRSANTASRRSEKSKNRNGKSKNGQASASVHCTLHPDWPLPARARAPSRPPLRTARTADRMSTWSTVSFIDLRKARQPPKNASPRRPCPSASWRMCDAGFEPTPSNRILSNSTARP
jgi:hypothetical protein